MTCIDKINNCQDVIKKLKSSCQLSKNKVDFSFHYVITYCMVIEKWIVQNKTPKLRKKLQIHSLTLQYNSQ
ncbi:hypothetical protein KM1_057130 [Entamoeba histolytica HM-3:IMSS]|uniref:Uncharacterized protein n=1 Tax=Entamoeba histolytica HM-3:IMSS TaxID=885315 RepID=M7WBY1_ENTHI|nr:hypothetical protein KM1_057130 [Entamoeba histolytica HM-3:IMSS]